MSDYPSEKLLREIKRYDITKHPIEDLRDLVIANWWYPGWGCKVVGRHFELHTGGWSGNESIIGALEKNTQFWIFCWVMSKRGGHYWFEIPQKMTRRHLQRHLMEKSKGEK